MADKEMELLVKIRAKAEGFNAELGKAKQGIKQMGDLFARVGNDFSSIFGFMGKSLGLFLSPLGFVIKAGGALGGALMTLGGAAIYAAAADEELIARLEATGMSAEKARKTFQNLERLGMKGPFSADDLTEATILLSQFGAASEKNLGALANTARVAKMSIADMAQTVAGLQMRGLKRFGLGVEEKDDKFIVTWRDKMQVWHKMIAKNADDARRMLLDAMGQRFGTTIDARGLNENLKMFKNRIGEAFDQVGGPLLDIAGRFVSMISEKLLSLIESGKLEALGERIGGWLDTGFNAIQSLADILPDIWKGLTGLWDDGGAKLGTFIKDALTAGGTILQNTFVEILTASWAFWSAIAKMIWSVFREGFLNLPGIKQIVQLQESAGSFMGNLPSGTVSAKWLDATNPEEENEKRGRLFEEGVGDMMKGIGKAGKNVLAGTTGTLTDLSDKFKTLTGFDAKKSYSTAYTRSEEALRTSRETKPRTSPNDIARYTWGDWVEDTPGDPSKRHWSGGSSMESVPQGSVRPMRGKTGKYGEGFLRVEIIPDSSLQVQTRVKVGADFEPAAAGA